MVARRLGMPMALGRRKYKANKEKSDTLSDAKKQGLDPLVAAAMANAKAKGKRPEYFADEMSENHFSITMALIAELAVARERNDTLERLLVSKGVLSKEEIEQYLPDEQASQERQLAQVEYTTRIFRSLQQQLERLDNEEKSMEEMAEILGKQSDNNDG